MDYEILSAVFNAADAMRPEAPILHEGLQKLMDPDSLQLETWPANVGNHFELDLGDVDADFSAAKVTVETTTTTKAVHQGYIEPHAGTARWSEDGRLTVWSSGQGYFAVRDAVAALLARRARQAVKIAMPRIDVFEGTGPASGTQITIKLGATEDGRLTAASAHMVYEAGGFPGSSVMGGARCVFSPYDISHCLIEGYDVVVNRPKTAAYRAPGTPAAAMAMETALDELAEKLGMDPLELRAKNTAREGPRRISGANGFYPTPASTTDSWASAGRSGGRNCSPGH